MSEVLIISGNLYYRSQDNFNPYIMDQIQAPFKVAEVGIETKDFIIFLNSISKNVINPKTEEVEIYKPMQKLVYREEEIAGIKQRTAELKIGIGNYSLEIIDKKESECSCADYAWTRSIYIEGELKETIPADSTIVIQKREIYHPHIFYISDGSNNNRHKHYNYIRWE